VEQVYLKRDMFRVKDESRAEVIQLYRGILEVQGKVACCFARSTPYRILLSIVEVDDWTGLLTQIEKLDTQCRELERNYSSLDRREGMLIMMRPLQEQDYRLETLIRQSATPDSAHPDVVEIAYVSRASRSSETRLNILTSC